MDIFGIGPLEILLVLVLALILFGPQDLQKTGKMLGRTLNKLVHSDAWQMFRKAGTEINHLPQRLMREAALDDVKDNLQKEFSGASEELGKVAGAVSATPTIKPPALPAITARKPGSQKLEGETGSQDHA